MADNEYMGMVQGGQFSPFVGTPFEDVRKQRRRNPQGEGDLVSENVAAGDRDMEALARLMGGPISMLEPDTTGEGYARGSEMDVLRQNILNERAMDRASGREAEVKAAGVKPPSALDELLKQSMLEQRGRSPAEKKTTAALEKETVASLKAQMSEADWSDPSVQTDLIPKAMDILRRGGTPKLINNPEMVDPSFPWSMFSGEEYPTGKTLWDVEDAGPQGAEAPRGVSGGGAQGGQGDTLTFKTQQDFMDYLLEQQRLR